RRRGEREGRQRGSDVNGEGLRREIAAAVVGLDRDVEVARLVRGRHPRYEARAGIDDHTARTAGQLVDDGVAIGVRGVRVVDVCLADRGGGRRGGGEQRSVVARGGGVLEVQAGNRLARGNRDGGVGTGGRRNDGPA